MSTLSGHGFPVTAVAIAPDGSWLATASEDTTVRIWAADGTSRAILTGHTRGLTGLAIAPDGSWLATTSTDQTARIWRIEGAIPATVMAGAGIH